MKVDHDTCQCRDCKKVLPRADFKPSALKHSAYVCRTCQYAKVAVKRKQLLERKRQSIERGDGELFECSHCKQLFLPQDLITVTDRYCCRPCGLAATNLWRHTHPFKAKLSHIGTKAKRLGLPFDLDGPWYESTWEKQGGRCFYSGVPMSFIRGKDAYSLATTVSVDRQDPTLGYTQANCVLCCQTVNAFKSNLSVQQFLELAKQLYHTQFPAVQHAVVSKG